MLRFLLVRLLRALLTVLGCATLAFFVLRLSGDPLVALLPTDSPAELLERYRVLWGLDRPLPEQYLRYLLALARGDFGRSLVDGRDALGLVIERAGATLQLGGTVFALAILIGVPAGTVAALRRGRPSDYLTMSAAIFGYAMPNFFLGLLLILLFAMQLRLLPSSGYGTPAHLVMPAITLGTAVAAKLARFVRTSVLDVLGQPYVRTAHGKRLGSLAVIVRHVFPNAAIPVITFLGFELGLMIGGAVVTENVFGWPGIGQLLVVSVARRDLAVVQTVVMVIAVSVVSANLAVDLAYGWIDPRVRVAGGRHAG
ncbi:peptide/nickel transport system permease protein [Tistlia consotensis]|uniref:Peptide/nickel transport system permease protein n=1 Tax=Tistlia consotensis USBA 355 TaxID=560819 RepID=A0A1Y6BWQ8_9PROT|nr:ABC transporter permease [Tistlia consotensis]SMF25003.1 peptide/nickel transport system permease protein [Tistlia consotensis USBA 355]SNR60242.1 peptide/nickel transport system permease protein [Tistlia consotensis]